MADPDFPNGARKPRPIASSPFGMSTDATASPGFSIAPPPDPGFRVPTPMGWLSPDMAQRVLAHMTPSRDTVAETLGAPVDGAAWILRTMGAPIPGARMEAGPIESALYGAKAEAAGHQPTVWAPDASVPLSTENIRKLLDDYLPRGGLF